MRAVSVNQPVPLAEQLAERLAAVLEERYRWPVARTQSAHDIAMTDARVALNALGLDRDTLEIIADWRYSTEYVGNVIRSRFLD